jgi:WhiB family redox-sensing transcriptional regulator
VTAHNVCSPFDIFGEPPGSWYAEGACVGSTVDFFPNHEFQQAAPKRICEACPVMFECLGYALDRPWIQGVWGGTGGRERQRIRRDTNRPISTGPSPMRAQGSCGVVPREIESPRVDGIDRGPDQDPSEVSMTIKVQPSRRRRIYGWAL